MEKRSMKLWAVSMTVVAAVGCGSDPTLNGDEPEMLVAGTAGAAGAAGTTAVAGSSGVALGTAGSGGHDAPDEVGVQECDPQKPIEGSHDAGSELPTATMDAGVVVMGSDEDAGVDPPDSFPMDHVPLPDASNPAPLAPRTPTSGEIIFTELMVDPTVLSDTLGEWIEIHNTTLHTIDLSGCVLSDDGRDRFVLGALLVAPSSYVVLGRSAMAATRVDVVYDGVTLTNTEDEVILTCNDALIDRVAYGPGFPRPAGRSMQLDPSVLDATDNDLAASWCASLEGGTPGQTNPPCAAL